MPWRTRGELGSSVSIDVGSREDRPFGQSSCPVILDDLLVGHLYELHPERQTLADLTAITDEWNQRSRVKWLPDELRRLIADGHEEVGPTRYWAAAPNRTDTPPYFLPQERIPADMPLRSGLVDSPDGAIGKLMGDLQQAEPGMPEVPGLLTTVGLELLVAEILEEPPPRSMRVMVRRKLRIMARRNLRTPGNRFWSRQMQGALDMWLEGDPSGAQERIVSHFEWLALEARPSFVPQLWFPRAQTKAALHLLARLAEHPEVTGLAAANPKVPE